MNQYSDLLRAGEQRARSGLRFQIATLIVFPIAAVLFQVYVPLAFPYVGYLELPLLATVYFALKQREPIQSLLYGAGTGLLEDALSHHPLGMFGIVKTLVGYFAASVGVRFDVDNPLVRFTLTFFFYFFHQFLHWVLARALLGELRGFSVQQSLFLGLMNSIVAVPLFHVLDRLVSRGYKASLLR
ncbi:MAG: rod shape-determining protein MreD [Bryobacteraceae bacterium]|nr:rod shape-determining protein MreD [Bryobacteraceae bacterium]